MSKLSAEAFVKIASLIEEGKVLQFKKHKTSYEIIIFENDNHSHIEAETLMNAISKL